MWGLQICLRLFQTKPVAGDIATKIVWAVSGANGSAGLRLITSQISTPNPSAEVRYVYHRTEKVFLTAHHAPCGVFAAPTQTGVEV